MKKNFLPFVLAATLCPILLHADIIYPNEGEEYSGRLSKIENDTVWFVIDGKTRKWAAEEVQRIEFEELHTAQSIRKLGDQLLDSLWRHGADTTDYPDAQWITLYERVSYCINPDSSWEKTTRSVQKLLRPGGRWIASKSFSYLSESEHLRILSAKVIHPDGKINWLRETATKDESMVTRFPFYENLRRIRFAMPEIPVGGLCDVSVEQTFPKTSIEFPMIIEECFRNWEPVEYKTVQIECPQDMELSIMKSEAIQNSVRMIPETGTRLYEYWHVKSDKIEDENFLPPLPDLSPRVIVGIRTDWQTIGDTFCKVIENQLSHSEQLARKVNELRSPQKIYNFVATEIRPVPITRLNQYSWIPSCADSTLKNRSGSLPDRVFLLYAMMKRAGLEPNLVLTSSHSAGKRINEVPALAQLPSLIVELDGKWLCPIDDCLAFGELPSQYQGRSGLMIGPSGRSQFVNVPVFEPKKELVDRIVSAGLNANGDLEARQTVMLYGNSARKLRKSKSLKPQELRKTFEAEVAEIHPAAQLVRLDISDLSDLSEPVSYELDYKIPGYALQSGDKFLTFKLPGIVYTAEQVGKRERSNPVDFEQTVKRVNQIRIQLPDNYEVYHLPGSYGHDSEIANYKATFAKTSPGFFHKLLGKHAAIVFEDSYSRTLTTAGPDAYYKYKDCLEIRARLAKELIVLKRK
jgi:hypothetical protein